MRKWQLFSLYLGDIYLYNRSDNENLWSFCVCIIFFFFHANFCLFSSMNSALAACILFSYKYHSRKKIIPKLSIISFWLADLIPYTSHSQLWQWLRPLLLWSTLMATFLWFISHTMYNWFFFVVAVYFIQ